MPSGIGLLGTPWMFDTPLILAGVVTLVSVIYLHHLIRKGRATAKALLGAGVFNLVFAAGLVLTLV